MIATMKSSQKCPDGKDLLEEDGLFFQLARLLVNKNYYGIIYRRPDQRSKREMVEDKNLLATLLFVNIGGLEDIVEGDAQAFRPIDIENLPSILTQESNSNGFVDYNGTYHPPSDGGYCVQRHGNNIRISQDKYIVAYQDRAIKHHNDAHPDRRVKTFKELLYEYLPNDFTSLRGDYFIVGGRTQGALAAALTGDATTRTYVIKQTVYDGVAGKLCRFGPDGLEQEFFLNKIDRDDQRAKHGSFHPREPVIGVLRTYRGRDDRDEYTITPTDLDITIPELSSK